MSSTAGEYVPSWTFGDRLRRLRRDAHLSQPELADLIGVPVGRLSSWEAGSSHPRQVVDVAVSVSRATGFPHAASWLAGIDDRASIPCFSPFGLVSYEGQLEIPFRGDSAPLVAV